jgi:hypothetical protein
MGKELQNTVSVEKGIILLLIGYGPRNCHQDSSYATNATSVKVYTTADGASSFRVTKTWDAFFIK